MSSVVHIVQRMAPGGIEAMALDLVRALPGRHVLVSLEGETHDLMAAWPRLGQVGDAFTALAKPAGRSWACGVKLARLLRREAASTIVTHHMGPLLYGALAGALSTRPRMVHVEHDAWHLRQPRRRAMFTWIARARRPVLVGVSDGITDNINRLLPNAAAATIPNGVDLARFAGDRDAARQRLGILPHERVIGAVGRLEHVKGHDILLSAVAAMATNARVVIAGDGSRRAALEAQAAELGLAGRTLFLGSIDQPEAVYPAFDVFCLPSREEGLPLALLEAQAAGVRAVATDVGDVRSAVCPDSARLAPAGNAIALAQMLDAAMADQRMCSPRAFIAAQFNWATTVKAYETVIGVGE